MEEIERKINTKTKERTEFFDLAGPNFKKLTTSVTPLLKEVNFYSGGYVPKSEYNPLASVLEDEMAYHRGKNVKTYVELEDVMNELEQGHLSFVGPAGCGKTTLMKSIARDVLDGKYDKLKEVSIVNYLQCNYFSPDELTTARKLLFNDDNVLNEADINLVVKSTNVNPKSILFLIDSLDTLPYTLDGEHKIIGLDEEALPDAILWNLLSGKLFPDCRVITSSREYSIRNYEGKIRPDKVIALAGLSRESIMEIIIGYVGREEAEKIMERLETKCPAQLSLCRTPAVLVYTLIGIKNRSEFDPTTMTGILIVVLQNIIRSQHTKENILEIFEKLQTLSYNGIRDGKVVFTTEELSKVGLDPEETKDLAILAPGHKGQKGTEKSSAGNLVQYFSHLSLQELFAALFIARMDEGQFKDFVASHLHSPRYAVIRNFLCGIILDDAIAKAAEGLINEDANLRSKKAILKDSLRDEIEKSLKSPELHNSLDFLRLLVSLHESKQGVMDIVSRSLQEIIIHDLPLSAGDAHAVGSVMANCKELTEVNFRNCSIDPYLLRAIDQALGDSSVKLEKFGLGRNATMDVEGLATAGKISNQCCVKVLYVSDSNLGSDHLQALQSTLGNNKMMSLSFSYNKNMGVSGLSAVGQIVFQTRTDNLYLRQCGLRPDQLVALRTSLKKSPMKLLNLESNVEMNFRGCAAVGGIVTDCNLERLSMWKCQLTSEHLKGLVDNVNTKSLNELHLNDNPTMGVDGLESVGTLASKCCLRILFLQRCRLSAAHIRALRTSLGNTKLLKLSLVEKKKASGEDIKEVLGILYNVDGKLFLNCWDIDREGRNLIQAELNKLGDKAPQVLTSYGTFCSQEVSTDFSLAASSTQKDGDEDSDTLEETSKLILKPSCIFKDIGKEGGVLEVDGCFITIQERELNEEITIQAEVDVDHTKMPDVFPCVTPMLMCEAVGAENIALPVTVELTTWAAPPFHDCDITIIKKEEKDRSWQELCLAKYNTNGRLEFATHLCFTIIGHLKRPGGVPRPYNLKVQPLVYQKPCDCLMVTFFKKNETVRRAVEDKYKALYRIKVPDHIQSKSSNTLRCELKNTRSEPLFSFVEDNEQSFSLENLTTYQELRFTPDNFELVQQRVTVWCQLKLQEGEEKCGSWSMIFNWPSFKTEQEKDDESQGKEDTITLLPSVSKDMGPEGGVLEIDGCSISFPKDALPRKTVIRVGVDVDFSKVPDVGTCITPMINCRASGVHSFNLPATVKLTTWAKPPFNDAKIVIMRKSVEKAGCTEMCSAEFNADGKIEFKIRHFCILWAILQWSYHKVLTLYNMILQPYIFIKPRSHLAALVCRRNETIQREVEERFSKDHKNIKPLNCLEITKADELRCKIVPKDGGALGFFDEGDVQSFALEDLVKTNSYILYYTPKSFEVAEGTKKFSCTFESQRGKHEYTLVCNWTPKPEQTQRENVATHTTTIIRSISVAGPTHIGGSGYTTINRQGQERQAHEELN